MLPHVNPEQRHKASGGLQWVLVGASSDLQLPGGLVVSQPTPSGALKTSFVLLDQKNSEILTWTATVDALSLVFMLSKLPKSLLMASARAPVGSPDPPGQRFCTSEDHKID